MGMKAMAHGQLNLAKRAAKTLGKPNYNDTISERQRTMNVMSGGAMSGTRPAGSKVPSREILERQMAASRGLSTATKPVSKPQTRTVTARQGFAQRWAQNIRSMERKK